MTENTLPPIKLAFVIDGEVADILHTDERLSAIFTSNPLVLNVTDIMASDHPVLVGSTYDAATGTFTDPAPVDLAPAEPTPGA